MPYQGDNIGTWTVAQLVRFIQDMMREHPPDFSPNLTADDLTVSQTLTCIDQIKFNQVQTTVGAAGSASALPATPAGYIKILDYAGNVKVIPYYNP
ncbi:MAG TPA: hypothetical protein VIY48_02085 [Candidatus Paceibacterota bacterium]